MDIDIARIRYYAELLTETGAVYRLDSTLQSMRWEEQDGQLAQKASLGLADCKVDGENLRSLLKLNRIIRISADWGEGKTLLFEGAIWEWQYAQTKNKELTITAYDPMIRLQQSKDFKYFSKGLSTPAILGAVCADWGIALDYRWGRRITHEKTVFNGERVSDMILKILEEVRRQTGARYAALYRDGKLCVCGCGENEDIYRFTGNSIIGTNMKLSLSELVTRVKIMGKADDEGRSTVESVLDGRTEFGTLQEIVKRDGNKSIGQAKAEAESLLKERGQPSESITVNVPDLPFLRRGDAVELALENLSGVFYVLGVSHNAGAKQMTLTLLRQPNTQKAAAREGENGSLKKGDAVILNGPVYRDSYGNGKGRAFTDYKSTITLTAPLERPCPYHIGKIGWVYPNEIVKA